MARSSHEATHIQTCLQSEEGDVWSAPPHHCKTENPIHTLHRPSKSHHYLSQQWHWNTTPVCGFHQFLLMWFQNIVIAMLLAGWKYKKMWKDTFGGRGGGGAFLVSAHAVHLCISACEFVRVCVCVRAPQGDHWAGTWPCQYSWSLCVFSQCNHSNGAVQTGSLHLGFESRNVATALSFVMPWITVTSKQTIHKHTSRIEKVIAFTLQTE